MAGSIWLDLVGTLKDHIRIGFAGVRLKNSSANLLVRNAADSADAELTASKVKVSGEILEINSDAAGAGADWKFTIQRSAAGMTAAVVLTLPVDDGTPSQVLATDGSGNLSWASAASTASSEKIDTTSLAFDSTSPVAMFTTGAGDIIDSIEVVIDTPFDGTPSLSIGIAGTVSKYMAATELDLTAAALTSFIVHPGLGAQGAEALIASYVAGSATVGAARILVHRATPD